MIWNDNQVQQPAIAGGSDEVKEKNIGDITG